jgi:hypothetical protein
MGDPVSLSVACLSLISTIARTSSLITSFVQGYRAAYYDLDNISRELTSLKNVLGLLEDDIGPPNGQAIPETSRKQIATIIANCDRALDEWAELLRKHNGGVGQAIWWATTGTQDAARLRSNLDAYRGALNVALESLALYVYLRDQCNVTVLT